MLKEKDVYAMGSAGHTLDAFNISGMISAEFQSLFIVIVR